MLNRVETGISIDDGRTSFSGYDKDFAKLIITAEGELDKSQLLVQEGWMYKKGDVATN
jgi:hypothetical protein